MNRRSIESTVAFAVVVLTHVVAIPAFSQSDLIGKRVTVISWNTEFTSATETIGRVTVGSTFLVNRVEDDRLWIEEKQGYLKRVDVVPYDDAIAHFTSAVKKSPSAPNFRGRALVWFGRKEYEIAIRDFDEAIRLEPSSALFQERGDCWEELRKNERALADYTQAITLDAKNATAYVRRGRVLSYQKEKYAEVDRDFTTAIQIDPKNDAAYLGRALLRANADKRDAALTDYNEAIRINPNNNEALECRGNTLENLGRPKDAIRSYEEAIRVAPGRCEAYISLAGLLASSSDARVRDGAKAIEYAKKACELDNWKDEDSLTALAAAYAESGDFKRAVELQTRAINLVGESHRRHLEPRLKLFRDGKPYHRDTPKVK